MFKLTRLWNLKLCDKNYAPREVPPERRDFSLQFTADIKLVALFDPSEKYQLMETYGPDCFTEGEDGLLLELEFTDSNYLLSWLLGFGGKVKVLEPPSLAARVQAAAKDTLERYQ